MLWRFVNEYLIDLNRTAAYKRAGGKGEGNTAYVSASHMYRNAKVSWAISDVLAARERRMQITQDAVLKMWWDNATADVNQITEYRRLCCCYCWGFGHQYQWMDAVEHEEEAAKVKATNNLSHPTEVATALMRCWIPTPNALGAMALALAAHTSMIPAI